MDASSVGGAAVAWSGAALAAGLHDAVKCGGAPAHAPATGDAHARGAQPLLSIDQGAALSALASMNSSSTTCAAAAAACAAACAGSPAGKGGAAAAAAAAEDAAADTQPAGDLSDPQDAPHDLRAALAGVPAELSVCANSNAGVYLVDRRVVRCMCAACADARARAGGRRGEHVVSPTEFERHSGIPAAKKWRFSIKVTHPGEPAVSLGRWLELKGLDQRLPKRAGAAGGGGGVGPNPGRSSPCAPQRAAATAGAAPGDASLRLMELEGGVDGVVQLTRVLPPAAAGKAPGGAANAAAVDAEAPAVVKGGGGGKAAAEAEGEGAVAAEAPAAPRGRAPPPPRLDVGGDAGCGDAGCGDADADAAGGDDDDSRWMQSPRKLRTPRGPLPSARAPAAGAEAPAPGGAGGAAREGEEEEEGVIRVGPEFQAELPAWRPRPPLTVGSKADRAAAAAAVATDLARAGPRGPPEAQALLIVVQERARADLLPPDATDDLWERREPALALERGQRQRRAPGWMQGEAYVHGLPGGGGGGGGGSGGAGSGGGARGGGDDDDGNSSDPGAGRRGRKRSNSAHSGSSAPAPRGGAAASAAAAALHSQMLANHAAAAALQQGAAAQAAAAAAAARARSGLCHASGGAVQLQAALAAALAQPAAPHMIEWRVDEGREAMEAAVVLGGHVFVGRLTSRGPLANWLPPAVLHHAAAAAAPPAGSPAAAPAPAPAAAPAAAPPAAVKQEPAPAAAAGAAASAHDRAAGAERHCSLCCGGAGAGLGPFMPVQIQNGQLEWVHRDCALWSPEVAVDAAGRLLGLAAAVRRGMESACSHCGRRGATLPCWGRRSCGHELHLPCARTLGCFMTEGGDARFGGRRAVACPAHDPAGAGFDPAAAASEVEARDAELLDAAPRGGGGGGGACCGAGAGAGGAEGEAEEEEMALAELLTDIKRGSATGAGAGDAAPHAPHGHGHGHAPEGGGGRRRGGKRRRSASGDGSCGGRGGGGGGSDFDDTGDASDDWGPGSSPQRGHHHARAKPRRRPAPAAAAAAAAHAHAHALALAAAAADTPPGTPPPGLGGAACGDDESASDVFARIQQLLALGAADAGAGGAGGGGAGLLQSLQPALLGGVPGISGAAAAAGGGAPVSAADLFAAAGIVLGGTTGQLGRPGRCAVCVIQRKGKCGTDSAPKKCMRRQQALLEAAALEQKLRAQLAAQQESLIAEQLRAAAAVEHAARAPRDQD